MKTYWMAAVIILPIIILLYTLYRKFRRANPWSRAPYERRQYFLSPAEKLFMIFLMNWLARTSPSAQSLQSGKFCR